MNLGTYTISFCVWPRQNLLNPELYMYLICSESAVMYWNIPFRTTRADAYHNEGQIAPYRPTGSLGLSLWLYTLQKAPRTRPSCTPTFDMRECGRRRQGFLVAPPSPFTKDRLSSTPNKQLNQKRNRAYLGTGTAPNLLASLAST